MQIDKEYITIVEESNLAYIKLQENALYTIVTLTVLIFYSSKKNTLWERDLLLLDKMKLSVNNFLIINSKSHPGSNLNLKVQILVLIILFLLKEIQLYDIYVVR